MIAMIDKILLGKKSKVMFTNKTNETHKIISEIANWAEATAL